jgi:hypothetical protein
LLASHWAIDAHLILPLLNKFLEYFVAEVEGEAGRVEELKWGVETKRLPPALIEVVSEKYRRNTLQSGSQAEPSVAEQPVASAPVRLAQAYNKYIDELTRTY